MDAIASLWKLIERGKKGENIGSSTGLPKLDKIIGGIQPSRYYLIGAASSAGKSALVIYWIYHMLRNINKETPIYFLYFSLELGADVLFAKLMGLYCSEEYGVYLTLNDILSFEQEISDENLNLLSNAKKWLDSISKYIEILDKGLNVNTLYKESMTFCEKHGHFEAINNKKVYIPDNPKQKLVAVVDHMSLVNPSEGRKLKEEIDLCSSYMVGLKRRCLMSWFVLMQQNRDASSTDRRKLDLSEPGLNDLKDSGSPAQDADVVLQIFYPFREKLATYRDYKILGDSGLKDSFRSIIISKNRYGVANQVIGCSFYGSVGWWNELPLGKNISDFSIYRSEEQNIPCKILKDTEIVKDDVENKNSTGDLKDNNNRIIFHF